jgi:uncharacterized protein YbaP (TraB family)
VSREERALQDGGRHISPSLAFFCLFFCCTARAEPAIWKVRSGTATVYLFGTMHILPQKVEWFGPKVAPAFAASGMLMEEADVGLSNPAIAQSIMAKAITPDGDIWAKLSASSAAKFRKQLQKCHLPDGVVAHFRPWFAAMLPTLCPLIENAGPGGLSVENSSPEAALMAKAKQGAKSVAFFETAEEQMGYLAGAPEAVQIKELESAIDDGDSGGDDFKGMEASWQAGDVGSIAKVVAGMRDKGGAFYDLIFTQRNKRFAARIAALLGGRQTVFVAIGAGHLAGPDSVQAQLAKAGISAKRL